MNDLETLARDICISMVGGIHTEVVAALLPYLRDAYAAGQAAMRERAAERADTLARLAQQEASAVTTERDLAMASGVVGGASTLANEIRALEVEHA